MRYPQVVGTNVFFLQICSNFFWWFHSFNLLMKHFLILGLGTSSKLIHHCTYFWFVKLTFFYFYSLISIHFVILIIWYFHLSRPIIVPIILRPAEKDTIPIIAAPTTQLVFFIFIPNFRKSLLACLILLITMKNILKKGFGRHS